MSERPLADRAREFFEELQASICRTLEATDSRGRFGDDRWDHEAGAGGGTSRVLVAGRLFEKAAVNTSAVSGELSEPLARSLGCGPAPFRAAGISLVIHPLSPMIPTVHMNLRYLELPDRAWFGGGSDLTPYYLFEQDARHFHRTWKEACDRHDAAYYPRFKRWCDEYFFVEHRREARGVGGVFFDQLPAGEPAFAFVREIGAAFVPAFLPIVERRAAEPWWDREREWQLARRGRYVEFNLIHDRGTRFGLETRGRIESVLVSLPPLVRWPYDTRPPAPGTREAELVEVLRRPRDWI